MTLDLSDVESGPYKVVIIANVGVQAASSIARVRLFGGPSSETDLDGLAVSAAGNSTKVDDDLETYSIGINYVHNVSGPNIYKYKLRGSGGIDSVVFARTLSSCQLTALAIRS